MTRRDLVQKIAMGGTTIFLVPSIFTQCSKPEEETPDPNPNPPPGGGNPTSLIVDLATATYSSLNNAGASIVVQGIIIANTGNNNFVALTSICTHEGCTIGYSASSNTFPCPCHGSVYSTTGAVLNGPAVIGVKSHAISRSGNVLTIAL
jgi:Rieske Fe-S protein